MNQQNVKLGEKIFKIKILNHEIQCTNFLQFNRQDFLSLFSLTLVAIGIGYTIFFFPLIPFLLYFYPKLLYVLIPYCIWMILDKETGYKRERLWRNKWFRNNFIHTGIKNYFSHKLIKTSELRPGQNYLLAGFPHSLAPISLGTNFFSDANNITEVFPEIEFRGAGHNGLFCVPLLRDFALAIGAISVSEASIKRVLMSAPSKGVIIYPGGGPEACHSAPGNIYKILMSNRKGFIRLALESGASLVPIFNFNEINTFDKWPCRNPVYHLTRGICKQISIRELPFPNGRGIFQNHFGLIPKQCPIYTVVGSPIHVPKVENPSLEIIDEYHKKFYDALSELFEKYKHTCDMAGADAQLVML